MGYTRYWRRTDKPITEEFVKGVREILEDAKDKGIRIKGWDGECEVEVSLDRVAFNGDAMNDLDHETFAIGEPVKKGERNFGFCKTARKPYDYAVRKVLALAEKEGLVFDVDSDGKNEQIYSDKQYLRGEVDWSIDCQADSEEE